VGLFGTREAQLDPNEPAVDVKFKLVTESESVSEDRDRLDQERYGDLSDVKEFALEEGSSKVGGL
jgi:hypothetical protein